MEEFKVAIDKFEGPLDLMLHLIKDKQLDLFDLDVNELTDQYIAYLNAMSTLHLEIASEYMVELAELIEYKSKKLLPKDKNEQEEEEDPKDRLVRRLLEYQQYKEISQQLKTMFDDRQMLMGKPLSTEAEKWMKDTDDVHYQGNPYDLMKAMRRVMMRMQLVKPIETKYTEKEISMEERELQVRAKLDRLPDVFKFESLLDDCDSLPMLIATFLAVLDLARMHTLVFHVDESDIIWFKRGELAA